MTNGFFSRFDYLWLIFVGATLSVVNALHILIGRTNVSTAIGAVVPLLMSLAIVVLGVWVRWKGWPEASVRRLALWLTFAVGWMITVGMGLLVYEFSGGTIPQHAAYLLGTFASYGAIPGLLTGWFDVQRHDRERTLRRYEQTVGSSKDLLAAVDTNLEYLFANHEYRNYHGLGPDEVEGRALADVIGEEQFAAMEPKIRRALDGRPVQTEIRREHQRRGPRILDVRLFPLEDDGDVQGVGASMRDVTEERRHEAEIKRESEFRRLMSEVNEALVRSTEIREMIPHVADLIGASPSFACTFVYLLESLDEDVTCSRDAEMDPETVAALHTERYLDAVFEAGVLEMADVTEMPFVHHDGDVQSHPGVGAAIGHDGNRYGVLTVHGPPNTELGDDETALVETIANNLGYFIYNRNLEAEHRSFADIVERIDDPVMLQDLDGSFRVLNQAVADFAGMPRADLVGTNELPFMDDETAAHIQEMKTQVVETGEPITYQVTPRFQDDRERTFSTTRYPALDDDGEVIGTIAICRDVTDLKEHQRQLQVLDRVLRHNVRNDMNVVKGYAEMLQRETTGELAEYATTIVENSDALLDLADKQRAITEFLSDVPPIGVFNVTAVLEDVRERVQSTYPSAKISISAPPGVSVVANRAIGSAFEELLTNSVEHATAETPTVRIQVRPEGATACISVVDSNPTIPQMERGVLDTGSITDLYHGSGLGLWFVKLVVDHSDGTLRFEENEPRGNVVRIELPREREY
ncbi:MAG: PAS domain-containing protein [Halanaeroarchaeum sp.]